MTVIERLSAKLVRRLKRIKDANVHIRREEIVKKHPTIFKSVIEQLQIKKTQKGHIKCFQMHGGCGGFKNEKTVLTEHVIKN